MRAHLAGRFEPVLERASGAFGAIGVGGDSAWGPSGLPAIAVTPEGPVFPGCHWEGPHIPAPQSPLEEPPWA